MNVQILIFVNIFQNQEYKKHYAKVHKLFFFYKKQPIMGLNSEHRFQQLLYTVVISIVFDILSNSIIGNYLIDI